MAGRAHRHPALALLMLRGARIERRKSPLVSWLQKGYTAGSAGSSSGRSRRTPRSPR
jgi:hypothetical protein